MTFRRIIIGLTLLGMMLPASAAAALPEAISPYVQETIVRSDRGIEKAKNLGAAMTFLDFSKSTWLRAVSSAVSSLVNTRSLIVTQSKSLLEDTSCKRYDALILELQIENVRKELQNAVQSNQAGTVIFLDLVLQFLDQRRIVFETGATNMAVTDNDWYKKWFFDDERPTWCCNSTFLSAGTCEEKSENTCIGGGGRVFDSATACGDFGCKAPTNVAESEPPYCPFDTDYLPPNMSGFGCNSTVLQTVLERSGSPGFEEFRRVLEPELEATTTLQSAVEDAQALQSEFDISGASLGDFLSGEDFTIGSPAEPIKFSGCLSEQQAAIVESAAVTTPLRGPFSLHPDHLRLLQIFQNKKEKAGIARSYPDYYSPAKNANMFLQPLADSMMRALRDFSAQQEQRSAVTFAVSADPLLSAATSYDLLSASVYQLGQLASSPSGIRSFVRDLAFFLRSTCQERPCNARLEQILKISYKDECFPYTNGEFKEDTKEDPRWKKCAEAAEIELR